jgi:hypothetical protein
MGKATATKKKLKLNVHGDWKDFPNSAPKDGRAIIVGGMTKSEGQWVDVVVRWGTFSGGWLDVCKEVHDIENKWVVSGFMTLDNFLDVTWMYWHPLPASPFAQ